MREDRLKRYQNWLQDAAKDPRSADNDLFWEDHEDDSAMGDLVAFLREQEQAGNLTILKVHLNVVDFRFTAEGRAFWENAELDPPPGQE